MIKISTLEIENVKRIKAVKLSPTENGLTIIGGKNGQGKTSVLDSIAWALGGDRYKPSSPARDGSVIPPHLHIVMSNGLVVERKGKNSDLKVIDPNGNKGGQQLLNEFVEELAINLPKFMNSTSKEKAETLLRIIGVGDKLHALEQSEQQLYNQRHAIGQIADQKAKYAKEIAYYPDAPHTPISVSELLGQQQKILAENGENQRKRENLKILEDKMQDVTRRLQELKDMQTQLAADLEIARMQAADLEDKSTKELEDNIRNIEAINIKVRSNLDKEKAEEDASNYRRQYDELTSRLDDVRREKTDLLQNAELPLSGLSVEDGELTYEGKKWDGMSGSDQLKVSTAIVRKLKPECGFILIDKLEQMDLDTLNEFGSWLENEGLQAIATRVSTGDECSLIISDGLADDAPIWKEGQF